MPLSPSLASQEYALHIQFPDNCLINSEKSKIDSNETNLVLVLFKQECSVGLWDWCMIGSDEKMEVRKSQNGVCQNGVCQNGVCQNGVCQNGVCQNGECQN